MSTSDSIPKDSVVVTVLVLFFAFFGGFIAAGNGFAMAWTAGDRHSSTSQLMATIVAFSIPAAITLVLSCARPAYAILIFVLVVSPTFLMLYPTADKNFKMGNRSNPLTSAIVINTIGCLSGTLLGASLGFLMKQPRSDT
ncbi:MAG: hypothetical protein C0478_12770 [Planctomyces sp.]|nr:hypothetical protein [Planctomyces sp.]